MRREAVTHSTHPQSRRRVPRRRAFAWRPIGAVLLVVVASALTSCAAQIPTDVLAATSSTVPVPWAGSEGAFVDPALLATPTPTPTTTTTTATPVAPSTTYATTTSVATISASTSNPPAGPPDAPAPAPAAVVTATLRQEESTEPPYVVEISLPEVSGMANAAVEASINAQIADHVTATAEPFIADLVDYLTEFPPDPETVTSSFEMGYEVTLLDASLLSIRFYESYYTAGAAHPNGDVSTLIFDLETGEVVTLDQLLVDDESRVLLSQLVADGLIASYFDGDAAAFAPWAEGASGANLREVSPAPDALEIAFGQYQVGPGVIGTPVVAILYSELTGIVDQTGILGYLMP